MKKTYSLFNLLGGAVLILFLIFTLSLMLFEYYSVSKIIQHDATDKFSHSHSLLQSVFDAEQRQLKLQLAQLTSNKDLSEGFELQTGSRRASDFLQRQYPQATHPFDILLAVSADGMECRDYSAPLYSFQQYCNEIINQYDDPLFTWHLVTLPAVGQGAAPLIGLITREPVIESLTGRVKGYLYAGLLLNDNFSFLSRAKQAASKETKAVGIIYQNRLLATTAKAGGAEGLIIDQALQSPDKLVRSSNGLMAKSGLIRLEHEHEALRFISVTSDESFIQLRHDLIIQLGITILVSMLLALLIVTVTLNVTLTPLQRLLAFAHRTGGQDDQDFEPGKIREFNQLSQDIVSIMSALKNSEQRLVKYSGELEEAHQVQSSMVKKNRELLHRILTLQELERKHLAQELHDELGQSLAVISTDAYLIKSKVEQGSVVFISAEAIHSSAREMYDIVYNRIKSLRPMPLDDLGLADAICFMPAVKVFQQRGIDLKMVITEPLDSLPDAVKIAVYRIVQEALTNIIKHAEASRAWLSLTTDPQTMRLDLEIRDDGIGISADQFNQPAGYGLSGIRERVYALKGECRIEGDGEGARINISLPYASGDHLDIDSEYVI